MAGETQNIVLKTADDLKTWITSQWDDKAPQNVKDGLKSLQDNATQLMQDGKELVVKNGQLDLSGLQTEIGKLPDLAQKGMKSLLDAGRATYEVAAPAVESAGEATGLGDKMGPAAAGILGAILMLAMSEIGIIGALLVGALMFFGTDYMQNGGNSIIGGLLGQNTPNPKIDSPAGVELSRGIDGASNGQFEVLQKDKEGNISVVNHVAKDGKTPEFGDKPAEVAFDHFNQETNTVTRYVGKVNDTKTGFDVTRIDKIVLDKNSPDAKPIVITGDQLPPVTLDIVDGKINVNANKLDAARAKAQAGVDAFLEKKSLDTQISASGDISTTIGEHQGYKVVLKGMVDQVTEAGAQAKTATFNKAVLVDNNGNELKDAEGKTVEIGLKNGQNGDSRWKVTLSDEGKVTMSAGRAKESAVELANVVLKQKDAQKMNIEHDKDDASKITHAMPDINVDGKTYTPVMHGTVDDKKQAAFTEVQLVESGTDKIAGIIKVDWKPYRVRQDNGQEFIQEPKHLHDAWMQQLQNRSAKAAIDAYANGSHAIVDVFPQGDTATRAGSVPEPQTRSAVGETPTRMDSANNTSTRDAAPQDGITGIKVAKTTKNQTAIIVAKRVNGVEQTRTLIGQANNNGNITITHYAVQPQGKTLEDGIDAPVEFNNSITLKGPLNGKLTRGQLNTITDAVAAAEADFKVRDLASKQLVQTPSAPSGTDLAWNTDKVNQLTGTAPTKGYNNDGAPITPIAPPAEQRLPGTIRS